jgi:hypothetical protein
VSDVEAAERPNKREAHERIARARTLLVDADALVKDISFVDDHIDTDSLMATARAQMDAASKSLSLVADDFGDEDDGVRVFERRFSFYEVLSWELYKQRLAWELVDQAEASVAEEVEGFREMEAESRITVEGGMFVVRFYVSAEDLEGAGEEA